MTGVLVLGPTVAVVDRAHCVDLTTSEVAAGEVVAAAVAVADAVAVAAAVGETCSGPEHWPPLVTRSALPRTAATHGAGCR